MHDIFISYSHKDAQIADAICHKFEEAGIRCWYAPRNIRPGDEWASAIIRALEECRAMVLIFTDASNLSTQVHREVDAAVSSGKTIIPFKCSETEPSGSMRYYLSTLHWMDALTEPMDASINNLLHFVKRVIHEEELPENEGPVSGVNAAASAAGIAVSQAAGRPGSTGKGGFGGNSGGSGNPGSGGPLDRQKIIWILAAACVILAIATAAALSSRNKNSSAQQAASAQESAVPENASDAGDSLQTDTKAAGSEAAAENVSDDSPETGSGGASTENTPVESEAAGGTESSAAADGQAAGSAGDGEGSDAADGSAGGGEGSDAADSTGSTDAAAEGPEGTEYEFTEGKSSPGAENYLYTVLYNKTEIRLDRYFGPEDEEMVIPEVIDGLPVTQIGEKCFEDHSYIKKLVLPETMENIAYRAFYGCGNLTEMNIPSSLTVVGGWAFAHCGFTNVILPDTFEDLDYGAFYGCDHLKTVVLPESVDYFGENTFRMCPELVSVTIPAENPEINAKAFEPDTDVTIIGIPGSYTEKYAKGMGLKFEAYQGS